MKNYCGFTEKYCPFQKIIAEIINKFSENEKTYDTSKKIFIMPSDGMKPLDKSVISKILNISKTEEKSKKRGKDFVRSIPKSYYE